MRRASLGVGSRAAIILLPVHLANPKIGGARPPGCAVGGGQAGPGARRRRIVQRGRRPFGPEGRVELAFGEGSFPGAGFWESNASGLLLILADNYNLTTNDPTTESQSAQRLFGKSSDFRAVFRLADPCGPRASRAWQSLASPPPRACARAVSRMGARARVGLSPGRSGRSGRDHGFTRRCEAAKSC